MESTRIIIQAVTEALQVAPEERGHWLRQRCGGHDESLAALETAVERALETGDPLSLESGGALRGAVWERLAATLCTEGCPGEGDKVGRYVVLGEIGEGGMGVVYSAWDPDLDRKIALTLLHPRLGPPGRSEGRLLREAQALARLSHPNVIAVHDVGTWQGRVFVAMEFVEGEDLVSWQERENRGWRQVVDVYGRAGRGLAAAHAAGLVHRDFKPANVRLGQDGRVRVLDFGLALAVTTAGQEPAGEVPDDLQGDAVGAFADEGLLVGTPAYMAPEQLRGEEAEPRSDQFSFCVALFEALYGQPPFARGNPLRRLQEIGAGRVNGPPVARSVPAWLRRVVLRGLAADPAERWPDMDTLLATLGQSPLRRWRGWLMTGAALVVAAVVALLASRNPGAPFCQGAEQRLVGVWDDSRRSQLSTVFSGSGAERAEAAFTRTEVALDEYASRWVSQRTEACEATHVRGEQSGELLDLRMICLDRRLAELAALVDLLAEGDAEVVTRAPDAVLSLEPLATCSDPQLLRAPVPRPSRPAELARLEEIEAGLAAVRAGRDAGRESATHEAARQLVTQAEALGFTPIEAETRWVLADLLERMGRFEEARAEAFRAWAAAERGAHVEYRVRSLALLIWIDGNDLSRFEEADRWALLGEAALEQLDGAAVVEAELHNNLGAALQMQSRTAEALDRHRRALSLREQLFGPDSYAVAKSLNNIGSALYYEARFAEALQHYDRARRLLEQLLGMHPATAMGWSNVGSANAELGNAPAARAAHRRALEMRRSLFGERSVWSAISYLNIASSDLIDRPAEALPAIDAAAEILAENLPVDHFYQAYPVSLRGRYLLATGRPAEAMALLERSLAMLESSGATSAYELAGERFHLARALWDSDQERDRAVRLAREVLAGLASFSAEPLPLREQVASWLASRDR